MRQFKSLSNVRNSRLTTLERIVASTVEGDFKITPKVAEKLGLSEGLLVQFVIDGDDVFVAKGLGEPLRNEDGSFITTGKGRKTYEGDTLGSVIGANANSPLLKVSNTAAWNTLKANDKESVEFELGEAEEGMVVINTNLDHNIPSNQFIGTFYQLIEVERRVKAVSAKDEDGDEDEENEVVANTNNGMTQAPTNDEFDGFEPQEV